MMDLQSLSYLRTHSYFGFHESLLSPRELVQLAVTQGIKVLGLTDHRYLTGAVEFYEACNQNQIKPLLGLEIDFKFGEQQGLLTLFAKNKSGWSNLSRLSTTLLAKDQIIDIKTLEEHAHGLVCMVGDPRDIFHKLIFNSPSSQKLPEKFLEKLKALFGSDVYVEIQRYSNGALKDERTILNNAQSFEIPIIATQNIFYAARTDQSHFNTLTAISLKKPLQGLTEIDLPPDSAHFPSVEDFRNRFKDLPEAIENLSRFPESFKFELPLNETLFPKFQTPDDQSQGEYLRQRAYKGAKSLYGEINQKIKKRLEYELKIITDMGYEPIFLIVEDILNHARKLNITTSSRGSAASSLVAHCLDITSPDPIDLNLYFERFLNPSRKKPPDIDTDIDSNRRDEIIQYVFNKYGKENVAMVATINRYRPKSAFGDIAKVYGLSPDTIRKLSKKLPSSFRSSHNKQNDDPFLGLKKDAANPVIKNILVDAERILDHPRHFSVHPGGIVISPFTMTDLVPMVLSSTHNLNHTQFDLESIEKLGLVKIDLLGIRGLTILGEVANQIQSWNMTQYRDGLAVLDSIPGSDSATAETVSQARTIGCFQIESPGMRATLSEINAKSVEDIMVALALYRPGPLRGGLRDAFIRRYRGEEPTSQIHPSLESLLSDTLGVILYQEQVLRIAHELGGLSLAEADILRRAMSHFDPGDIMKTLKENFIRGAAIRRNVPNDIADQIWEMMAAFAGYGFPKAHAASYAQLAWNSAWCKTHFPAEFMAALLSFSGGYYSQRVYLMEARRMDVKVLPPHVNHSQLRFKVKYPKGNPILYMGLGQVKELTMQTINAIINHQPFSSFEDFISKVDPQKNEIHNLLKCGAFDQIISIPEGLDHLNYKHPPGQMELFSSKPKHLQSWNPKDLINAQQEILGVSLGRSPLEIFASKIKGLGAISTIEAREHIGEKVIITGMRQTLRRFRTQSNQTMCFLNLEDLKGSIRVTIPPQVYQRHYQILQNIGPFIIEGTIESDPQHHRFHLLADKACLL